MKRSFLTKSTFRHKLISVNFLWISFVCFFVGNFHSSPIATTLYESHLANIVNDLSKVANIKIWWKYLRHCTPLMGHFVQYPGITFLSAKMECHRPATVDNVQFITTVIVTYYTKCVWILVSSRYICYLNRYVKHAYLQKWLRWTQLPSSIIRSFAWLQFIWKWQQLSNFKRSTLYTLINLYSLLTAGSKKLVRTGLNVPISMLFICLVFSEQSPPTYK